MNRSIGMPWVVCLIVTSQSHGAIGFSWKIAGNPNVPTMKLTNDSTQGELITGYSVTIGDTSRNWDFSMLESFVTGHGTSTLLSPDAVNDGVRSDVIEYRFSGFDPGEIFRHAGDVDTDEPSQNVLQNYTNVLFGKGVFPNAVVSVVFDNVSTLTRALPDFDPNGPTTMTVRQLAPRLRQARAVTSTSTPEPSTLAVWSVLAYLVASRRQRHTS